MIAVRHSTDPAPEAELSGTRADWIELRDAVLRFCKLKRPLLEAAVKEVRPSLGTWFETARNVALFANEGGAYDDLVAYLRKRRLI